MTLPEFTPVAEVQYEKRDPSEFIPWNRCTETQYRPGKLLIVRPLQMIDDFRKLPEGADPNKWRGQLCVADVACLDPIEAGTGTQGEPLMGFAPGTQFRNQTIFLGYLNGAFKNYLGKTCLGTVYNVPSGYAQPAIKWRDLSQDPNAVNRARDFLMRFPDFLIPVAAQITPTNQPAPQQGSWAQPQHQQQPVQGYAQPVSPAPQGNPYGQPDPWAQQSARPVSPAGQINQAVHPQQGMSTLDQLKLAAGQVNHQGQPQPQDPPF